jgi:predicted DNA-binding transcriptional regulator AlpA
MGAAEIAQVLGVSASRVHQILRDDATFPPPAATLTMGKVWVSEAVEEWNTRRKASADRSQDRRGQWTLEDLHREIDRYEQALSATGASAASARRSTEAARRFVRWLGGKPSRAE